MTTGLLEITNSEVELLLESVLARVSHDVSLGGSRDYDREKAFAVLTGKLTEFKDGMADGKGGSFTSFVDLVTVFVAWGVGIDRKILAVCSTSEKAIATKTRRHATERQAVRYRDKYYLLDELYGPYKIDHDYGTEQDEEKIKEAALAKLTDEEKKALGLV